MTSALKDVCEKSYSIECMRDEFNVSARALRFYEEKGLLSPSRLKRRVRIYSDLDRERMSTIQYYKKLNFSLDDIYEIIMSESNDLVREKLHQKNRELLKLRFDTDQALKNH